ncbi:MAG: YciI family protein [Alphaproteobacteria bacterium]|nr:YciI family protein [Alphaproteobacteria bacterium]
MNERLVDQLYVLLSAMETDPPPTSLSDDELAKQHTAFIQNLKDEGRLMGAGSARDSEGRRFTDGGRQAGGFIVVRGGSLAEAEALAQTEPYCREGQRSIKVIPWQRTWFDD